MDIALHVDPSDLLDIAEKHGTPVYVYDLDTIEERYSEIRKAISGEAENYLIAYALKACYIPAVCRFIAGLGAGAEVVSGGELFIALRSGFRPDRVVFDGVSKSLAELEEAIRKGILLVNVESRREIEIASSIARELGVSQAIGLRVNIGVEAGAHRYVKTGTAGHKFGIDYGEVAGLLGSWHGLDGVSLEGLHFHLGSQVLNPGAYVQAVRKLSRLYSIAKRRGISIRYIDVGGGFPVAYRRSVPCIGEYIGRITSSFRESFEDYEDLTLILEPGRYIVADAGILLTRVQYVKEVGGDRWLLVDAGMNDMMRTALYGAFHPIAPLVGEERGGKGVYNIGGPVCETADVFAYNVSLPRMRPGDLIAILKVGAYGISMASNYNARPRPAVVALRKGRPCLVWARETYEDLIAKDKVG